MSSKEIRIKWLSDETEINKSIDQLQRKLQQINRTTSSMQNLSQDPSGLSRRASNAQNAYRQSTVDLLKGDLSGIEKRQNMESQSLLKKQRELKQLEKIEGGITEEKRKQIQLLKEEVQLRSKNVMDLETKKKQIEGNIKELSPQSAAGGAGGGGGGGSLLGNLSQGLKSFFSRLNPGLLMAAAGSAMKFGSAIVGQEAYEPTRMLQRQASAAQGTAGRNLRRLDSGAFIEDLYFAGQEKASIQDAIKSRGRAKTADYMGLAGDAALVGSGAFMASKGSALGAGMGTAIPG